MSFKPLFGSRNPAETTYYTLLKENKLSANTTTEHLLAY